MPTRGHNYVRGTGSLPRTGEGCCGSHNQDTGDRSGMTHSIQVDRYPVLMTFAMTSWIFAGSHATDQYRRQPDTAQALHRGRPPAPIASLRRFPIVHWLSRISTGSKSATHMGKATFCQTDSPAMASNYLLPASESGIGALTDSLFYAADASTRPVAWRDCT